MITLTALQNWRKLAQNATLAPVTFAMSGINCSVEPVAAIDPQFATNNCQDCYPSLYPGSGQLCARPFFSQLRLMDQICKSFAGPAIFQAMAVLTAAFDGLLIPLFFPTGAQQCVAPLGPRITRNWSPQHV